MSERPRTPGLPRFERLPGLIKSPRTRPFAVLDIGSAKITCLVAAPIEDAAPGEPVLRLLGLGSQRSFGIKAGVLFNPDVAEAGVRAAVAQAEQIAGVEVEDVHLAVACGRIRSTRFRAHADLDSGYVEADDMARLVLGARSYAERDGRILMHLNAVRTWLDGAEIEAMVPRLAGRNLAIDYHAVSADDAPVRNLVELVERCYLRVAGVVPASLASGLAVTSADERRIGVATVDIGAGSTDIALFSGGILQACDAIPIGGEHVTSDIMRGLVAPRGDAERVKVLHGTVVTAASDEREDFTYPFVGAEEPQLHQATKAQLRRIIEPRVLTQLRLVGERLDEVGALADHARGPVVLTGGASQLVGLAPYAAEVLGRPVRIGRPRPLAGMLEAQCHPAFATVIGLGAAASATGTAMATDTVGGRAGTSYLDRMERWLKDSF